jgi:GNAT superfamily N-acetyltransferase
MARHLIDITCTAASCGRSHLLSARCHGLLSRLPMAILPRDERPKLRRHNEDVHLTVLDGLPADHEDAVRVWHAANVARLLPPSLDRVARIWEKLAEPEACLVIGHVDANMDVVAMALVEPGREQHGGGAVIRGYGHVSMVFVHPDMWGRGVGRQLLQGLHKRASERGWSRTTLWTRSSNARAQRLYERQGYRGSGQETTLGSGDPILQLERQAS